MKPYGWSHSTPVLAAFALALLPNLASAATYCADDTAELVANLNAAALSPEDDVVRVRSGTFTPTANIDLAINGNLTVSGGWGAGCIFQAANPESTTITNAVPGQFLIILRPDDDLTVDRLTFNRIDRLVIQEFGSSATVTGITRLSRSRFITNDAGPLIRPRDSNVRVENNIITGSLQRSFAIDRSATTAPIVADIHNNTISGGTVGAEIGGTGGTVRFRNNVLFGGTGDGVLRIVDGAIAVNHNRVGSIQLQTGGTATPSFDNLLGVDPQLDASFVPLAASAMLNSGSNNIVGGLPSTDYIGNPRKIGSRVDRGARESALSDTTTINVTSTANSGAGSLRQAILDSNFTPGEETIAFSITGACPRIISLATPLPTITSTTTIDGFTQQGASANTNASTDPDGDNSVHCVVLASDGASAFNLEPAANQEIAVRGLAFYRSTIAQIQVSGAGKATIIGNTFNTGTSVFEPQVPEYAISVSGADGTRIGGSDPADRNIIGRASVAGVRLLPGSGREIEGNFIGIGKSGLSDVGNNIGVFVSGGAATSIDGNAIGRNELDGVMLVGEMSSAAIQRNVIGKAPNNSSPAGQAPNGRYGLHFGNGVSFFVRVNRIINSGAAGVFVASAAKNVDLTGNSINGNDGLGIDLAPLGVNPNDTDTGATGPNNGQNFPELISAIGASQSGVVRGRLRSANGNYSVTLYRSSSCDGNGHGEGFELIGGISVAISNGTAVADGVVEFTVPIESVGNLAGDDITAIATRQGPGVGSSSEFSACVPYVVETLFANGFEP